MSGTFLAGPLCSHAAVKLRSKNIVTTRTVVFAVAHHQPLDISQVFLVRKRDGHDKGNLYAMKVLKKATLKGAPIYARPCLAGAGKLLAG